MKMEPDCVCQCDHQRDEHCVMKPDSVGCIACRCVKFRPRVFASHRQLTGTPYIHHAYVYDGNKVVMACTHRHGERRSYNPITGEVKNQGAVQSYGVRRENAPEVPQADTEDAAPVAG